MSENSGTATLESNEQSAVKRKSLASIVGSVTYSIDSILSPGDVAELRRLKPSDPSSPAFFKLLVSAVDPDNELPSRGSVRDQIEVRWAVVFQAAAMMRNLHAMHLSLGRALASAGYSELRFVRLLRARGMLLYREVRTCAHYLAAKAQPNNLIDIARLLMITNEDDAESIRRSIAREFYRYETRSEKES